MLGVDDHYFVSQKAFKGELDNSQVDSQMDVDLNYKLETRTEFNYKAPKKSFMNYVKRFVGRLSNDDADSDSYGSEFDSDESEGSVYAPIKRSKSVYQRTRDIKSKEEFFEVRYVYH